MSGTDVGDEMGGAGGAGRAGDAATSRPIAEPSAPRGAGPAERDPLHGVTLEAIVVALVDHYGWEDLGRRVRIKSFNVDPSVASSLKFLRRTPWARAQVESLYRFMLRERRRAGPAR